MKKSDQKNVIRQMWEQQKTDVGKSQQRKGQEGMSDTCVIRCW